MMLFALGCAFLLYLGVSSGVRTGNTGRVVATVAGGFFLAVLAPPVIFQRVLLIATLVLCVAPAGRRAYPAVAGVLTVGVWTWFTFHTVIPGIHEQHRLRERFAFEDLSGRLPAARTTVTPKFTESEVATLEGSLDDARNRRAMQLRRLHEQSVDVFANTPGFGVGRSIINNPTERSINGLWRDDGPVPQSAPLPESSDFAAAAPADAVTPPVQSLHRAAASDFGDPARWGLVRGPKAVAGFQSHAIGRNLDTKELAVRRLDLVSLLIHDPPAVYVTDTLPRMENLRGANVPTRPLDAFEGEALERLPNGEEIVAGQGEHGLRVVGALRAAKQCAECHGSPRGELLGAFSYRLAAR